MKKLRGMALLAGSIFCLSACQAYWDPEPGYGSTVNGAIQTQVQNSKAPNGYPKSIVGLDGQSAKSAVESYEKTFERKQAAPQSAAGTMVGSSIGLTVQ